MRRIPSLCLVAALLPFLAGQGLPDRQMHWLMGTFWEIETPGVPASDAMAAAFAEIRRLDGLLSHYQPDSAISRLNRTGRLTGEPEVAALLARSLRYSRESGGAFDITVAPLVDLWGFKHLRPHVPSPTELQRTRQTIGWHRVHVSGPDVALAPGTTVELGAIGKGYALDRAMAVLRRAGIVRARIDAGGQQLVSGSWTIGIQHPRRDALLGRTTLTDASISTSGDMDRFFVHRGKRYNHLLDPRTGYPTSDWPSVTVIAPDGETADALSTVAAVLGPTAAKPLVASHRAHALWYGTTGTMVTTPGFPLTAGPSAPSR